MNFRVINRLLVCLVILVCFFSHNVCALDQDVTDKYATASPTPQQTEKEESFFASPEDDFSFSGFIDIQQGYDANIDLDPNRKKGGFLQETANVEFSKKIDDLIEIKMGTDLFNMIYYKYNINNLLDIAPYFELDAEIFSNLISKNKIVYDYFWYPNEKENTFSGVTLSTALRHYITEDLYQEASFEFVKRWYPDRKITLDDLTVGEKDRIDDRYRYKHTIGYYSEKFFVKMSNEYSTNDSNEKYQEYYDYWAYRFNPSVMYFFTDIFYTDVSFIFKHVTYKDRRSTEESSRTVKDDMYILNLSFYYDLKENVTLGCTYSYTENQSNDPYQKYSGSVISAGVFYSF